MQYTIKKGDTLWDIARKNNTTVDALAKANNIANPSLIYAGNTIDIPTPADAPGQSSTQSSSAKVQTPAASYNTAPVAPRPVYTKSAETKAAESALAAWEASKPGAYSSKYEKQIAELLDTLTNRAAFTYDYTRDPLYAAYRDSYVNLGRMAMEDTVGRASSLTGGYSNSWAQSAGQSAYQKYLTELTGKIPELWQAAWRRYSDEGDRLSDELERYRSLDSSDYSRYRDTLSDYYKERDYLADRYSDISSADYKRYSDLLASWEKEKSAAEAAARYEREAAYKAERDRAADEKWEKEYALSLLKAQNTASRASSGSGSSKSPSTSGSSKTSAKATLSYDDMGAKARYFSELLASPKSYLADGTLKPAVLDNIKKAKRDKQISNAEYNALMALTA